MTTDAVQAFTQTVATSPALQAQLQTVASPVEFLTLAQAAGFDLSPQDFQAIAQQAYHQWLGQLPVPMQGFFQQVHDTPALHDRLQQCQSASDVQALGRQCGVELSMADLQQAATAAAQVPGFSFEKLWFRQLGLL